MSEMDRARLWRDLAAVAVFAAGLAVAVISVILGGWPVSLMWLAIGLITGSFRLATRQEAPPKTPDGLAAPDDDTAMQIARERGPDTT